MTTRKSAASKVKPKAVKKSTPVSPWKVPKRPRGGQLTFTEALGDYIIDELTNGRTLTSICKSISEASHKTLYPSHIYGWMEKIESFAVRFRRAREFGDLVLEDGAIDVTDDRDEAVDTTDVSSSDGSSTTTRRYDNVANKRLRAEIRLKVVARRKGSKVTVDAKVAQKSESEVAQSMSTDELLEIARMSNGEAD